MLINENIIILQTLHYVLHIADTLLHLQRAGHPQYIKWLKSFDFKTMEMDLQNLNQGMKKDLQDWLVKVSNLRKEYYAMNYFTCLQLLRINGEFCNLIIDPNHQISREVFCLLLSISPNLTIVDIKNIVRTTKCQLISSKSMPLMLDEVDIHGEVAKLTEEEKEVYDAALKDYEFEPCMILAAIRKCGPIEDDVVDWCFDPENRKMFENTSIDEHELEESQIDSNNATVQELMDLDYPEALSIEAVRHCGNELIQCMEYCSNRQLADSDSADDTDTHDTNISFGHAVNLCSDEDQSDTEDSCLSM